MIFTCNLPPKLQSLVFLEMHKGVFNSILFFKQGMSNYPGAFFGWIGSRLRHLYASKGQYLYQEGDVIHNIYFMFKGQVSFNLPRYNANYLFVSAGEMFGVIDIIFSMPSEVIALNEKNDANSDNGSDSDHGLRRQGTTHSKPNAGQTSADIENKQLGFEATIHRKFTTKSVENCQFISLNYRCLFQMRAEFPEIY